MKRLGESLHDFIVYYQGFTLLAIVLLLVWSITELVKHL